MITQQELRRLFHYDPKVGNFVRLTALPEYPVGTIAGSIERHSGGRAYIRMNINGRVYAAHHLAYLYVHGSMPPSGMVIDHEDGNGLNNRIANLRVVTQLDNTKNQKLDKRNKSGIPGVRWVERRQRWEASIGIERKVCYLGYFSDLLNAAAARKSAELDHGFHSNHGMRPAAFEAYQ